MCLEAGVTDRQSKRARGEARFAKAFASFLRKMAEHRGQRVGIVRVFAEGVVVRNGFRLGIDHKFVGIAAARFAVKRSAPLAENLFELFLRNGGDLLDRLDAERAERALRDFADAGNLSNRKGSEEALLAARRNPNEAARLGLIRCDFGDQTSRGEAAGARKTRSSGDRSKQFI